MHLRVVVGAALLVCTDAHTKKAGSVFDHLMLQADISGSSLGIVSMGGHHEQPREDDDHVVPCQDDSEQAVRALGALGRVISGCNDEEVPENCDDGTYGPTLKMFCPVTCTTCALAATCDEDDNAAESLLQSLGVRITGCQDPMLPPYCQDSTGIGAQIQNYCKKTCQTDNCVPLVEQEDDDPAPPPGWKFPTHATARDDPHVMNLRGERFSINQPASRHLLLRVPPGPGALPLLELRATVAAASTSGWGACQLYMQRAIISGEWLQGQEVEVRPLRRNQAGSNGAGNATVQNFSVRVRSGAAWRSFADVAALENGTLALSPRVAVQAQRREEYGKAAESQSFVFGVSGSGPPAAITVSQASHQALNIDMAHLVRLGVGKLGGLLGTERHDPAVERRTDACNAALAAARLKQQDQPSRGTPSRPFSSLHRSSSTFVCTARWQ